jgi:hypothetical protein
VTPSFENVMMPSSRSRAGCAGFAISASCQLSYSDARPGKIPHGQPHLSPFQQGKEKIL